VTTTPAAELTALAVRILAAKAARSGAIAPFGGAKGYDLGLGIEVQVAALTASATGTSWWAPVKLVTEDRPMRSGQAGRPL
jgi:LDH2 family malate/lactate/ureidoglycolate dehydrogenase